MDIRRNHDAIDRAETLVSVGDGCFFPAEKNLVKFETIGA